MIQWRTRLPPQRQAQRPLPQCTLGMVTALETYPSRQLGSMKAREAERTGECLRICHRSSRGIHVAKGGWPRWMGLSTAEFHSWVFFVSLQYSSRSLPSVSFANDSSISRLHHYYQPLRNFNIISAVFINFEILRANELKWRRLKGRSMSSVFSELSIKNNSHSSFPMIAMLLLTLINQTTARIHRRIGSIFPELHHTYSLVALDSTHDL